VIAKEQEGEGNEGNVFDKLQFSLTDNHKPTDSIHLNREIVEISNSGPIAVGDVQTSIRNTDYGMVAADRVTALPKHNPKRPQAREDTPINNGIGSLNFIGGRVGESQQKASVVKRRKRFNSMTTLSTAPDFKSKPPVGIVLTTIEILT
jgi:hypothetical protein